MQYFFPFSVACRFFDPFSVVLTVGKHFFKDDKETKLRVFPCNKRAAQRLGLFFCKSSFGKYQTISRLMAAENCCSLDEFCNIFLS